VATWTLDRHVNVLVVGLDLERVAVNLLAHRLESAGDLARLARLDDALHRQHLHVGQRLLDVVGRQPVVEPDRRVQALEERVLRGPEPL